MTDEFVLDAESRRGRTVALRLAFPAQQMPTQDLAFQPRSNEALSLAREFLSIEGGSASVGAAARFVRRVEGYRRALTPQERALIAQIEPALEEDAKAAREIVAQLYAQHFSEEQLRGAIAFRRSAASRALAARPFTLEELRIASDGAKRTIAHKARTQFCAVRACTVKTPR